jgi:hypothetical protein
MSQPARTPPTTDALPPKAPDEVVRIEPAVDRIPVQVGAPPLVVFRGVDLGDVRRNPTEQVRPAEAPVRAMHVLLVVGVGVMPAVVGHPAGSPPLRGATPEGRQGVFEPLGPERETAVGQEPVVGQADAEAAGQPVQDQADGQGRPRKIARDEGQEGADVQAPIQSTGAQAMPADSDFIVGVVVMGSRVLKRVVALKGSPEWKAWLDSFSGHCRLGLADTIEQSLVYYAQERGFRGPPKR